MGMDVDVDIDIDKTKGKAGRTLERTADKTKETKLRIGLWTRAKTHAKT